MPRRIARALCAGLLGGGLRLACSRLLPRCRIAQVEETRKINEERNVITMVMVKKISRAFAQESPERDCGVRVRGDDGRVYSSDYRGVF